MPRNYVKKSFRQANKPPAQKTDSPPYNTIPTAAQNANKASEDQSALQTSCTSISSIFVGLENNPSTTAKDKYERAKAIYTK